MKNIFKITATGDSLLLVPFPKGYEGKTNEIKKWINSCEIRITNLETTLSDFEFFANQYCGGTWINTRRDNFKYLEKFNFNYYGNANNHCFDYSYNGLLSTIDYLDGKKLAHAGTGRSLEEAQKPAILNVDNTKVAIFSVDTSFENPSMAGSANSEVVTPRPGVNYLRHNTMYTVTEEQMTVLKDIAKNSTINFKKDTRIATGYLVTEPENLFVFGENKFTTEKDVPLTSCNKNDLQRICGLIKQAKTENDYVVVQVHCHDSNGKSVEEPPEYLKEFARNCIDSGACAIFGGGCHQLRGIEMYNGFPIFYSLGDFIYQGPRIERLPTEFLIRYNMEGKNYTTKEMLYERSRGGKVGLHTFIDNYLSVLPELVFEDGKLASINMLPIDLMFEDEGDFKGLPVYSEKHGREIFDRLQRLSSPYGTKLSYDNKLVKIEL